MCHVSWTTKVYLCIVRNRRATLRISARILRFSLRNTRLQLRACLYKVQIAINIASYWSGNETSTADIDTVHKCLGNTDLSIRLCFRLADCIFIPWQIKLATFGAPPYYVSQVARRETHLGCLPL